MIQKVDLIVVSIVLLIFEIVFCLLLIYEVNLLQSPTLRYENLSYVEGKVNSIKKEIFSSGKGSTVIYVVTVDQDTEALYISDTTLSAANVDYLKSLVVGDEVRIYYKESRFNNYKFEICEMKGTESVITLEEYNREHIENARLGVVTCSVLLIVFPLLEMITVFFYKKGRRNETR